MTEHALGRPAEESRQRFDGYDSVFDEGVWHRGHALTERARRMCGGSTEAGIGPGDRVVVMMADSPEAPIVYQALWAAGAAVAPAVSLVPPDELGNDALRDSGAGRPACRSWRATATPRPARSPRSTRRAAGWLAPACHRPTALTPGWAPAKPRQRRRAQPGAAPITPGETAPPSPARDTTPDQAPHRPRRERLLPQAPPETLRSTGRGAGPARVSLFYIPVSHVPIP
ncbi:AMP-binding protein [Nonomuraea fastidiosa]|uniref:AMP-binding protein n=1 Tax=Nonomuraea TaxID=83681 RepID=UPI00342CF146